MSQQTLSIPPINPGHGLAATPIAFIKDIVQAYRRDGKNPETALLLAQIAPEKLGDPSARVTAAQLEIMSAVAMQELDDEALGWFSRKLPWGSYGMLCRASLTASDLGSALKRWCRHHQLLTRDIIISLSVDRSTAELSITPHHIAPESHELCLVTNLRYVLGYACWAVDSRIPLLHAQFPFPRPAHAEVYSLIFHCPIEFSAERASIRFDVRYLDLPMRRGESDMKLMLRRALKLTVLQYNRDRLLVERVRQILNSEGNRCSTAETLAERLHLSPRTLHRQLQEEGASLQQLKDEARQKMATDLLHRTSRSIKQVAHAAGFQSEKSFARAFRNWTGQSPSDFRERARAERK